MIRFTNFVGPVCRHGFPECCLCGRRVLFSEVPKSDSDFGWICDECDRHLLPKILDVLENIKLNKMVELEEIWQAEEAAPESELEWDDDDSPDLIYSPKAARALAEEESL